MFKPPLDQPRTNPVEKFVSHAVEIRKKNGLLVQNPDTLFSWCVKRVSDEYCKKNGIGAINQGPMEWADTIFMSKELTQRLFYYMTEVTPGYTFFERHKGTEPWLCDYFKNKDQMEVRVLDVGCGFDTKENRAPTAEHLMRTLREMGFDASILAMDNQLPPEVDGMTINGIRYRQMNIRQADKNELGEFDCVWCFNVLFYYADEARMKMHEEMRALLRTGGILMEDTRLPLVVKESDRQVRMTPEESLGKIRLVRVHQKMEDGTFSVRLI